MAMKHTEEKQDNPILWAINLDLLALTEYARVNPEVRRRIKSDAEAFESELKAVLKPLVLSQIEHKLAMNPSSELTQNKHDSDMQRYDSEQSWDQLIKYIIQSCNGDDSFYNRSGSAYAVITNDKRVNTNVERTLSLGGKIHDQAAWFLPTALIHDYMRGGMDESEAANKLDKDGYLCSYKLGQKRPDGVSYISGRLKGLQYLQKTLLPAYGIRKTTIVAGVTNTPYALRLDNIQTEILDKLFTQTGSEESQHFYNDITLTSAVKTKLVSTEKSVGGSSSKSTGTTTVEKAFAQQLNDASDMMRETSGDENQIAAMASLNKTTLSMYNSLARFVSNTNLGLSLDAAPTDDSDEYGWLKRLNAITKVTQVLGALFDTNIKIRVCHVGSQNVRQFKIAVIPMTTRVMLEHKIQTVFYANASEGKKIAQMANALQAFYSQLPGILDKAYGTLRMGETTAETVDVDKSVLRAKPSAPEVADLSSNDNVETYSMGGGSGDEFDEEQMAAMMARE
jgi:hypothetical protein